MGCTSNGLDGARSSSVEASERQVLKPWRRITRARNGRKRKGEKEGPGLVVEPNDEEDSQPGPSTATITQSGWGVHVRQHLYIFHRPNHHSVSTSRRPRTQATHASRRRARHHEDARDVQLRRLKQCDSELHKFLPQRGAAPRAQRHIHIPVRVCTVPISTSAMLIRQIGAP